MKSFSTFFIVFTTISFLFCQNDTTKTLAKKTLDYSKFDWNSINTTIGFNHIYTEGGIKNFIEPTFAMNGCFEVQYQKRYFALVTLG